MPCAMFVAIAGPERASPARALWVRPVRGGQLPAYAGALRGARTGHLSRSRAQAPRSVNTVSSGAGGSGRAVSKRSHRRRRSVRRGRAAPDPGLVSCRPNARFRAARRAPWRISSTSVHWRNRAASPLVGRPNEGAATRGTGRHVSIDIRIPAAVPGPPLSPACGWIREVTSKCPLRESPGLPKPPRTPDDAACFTAASGSAGERCPNARPAAGARPVASAAAAMRSIDRRFIFHLQRCDLLVIWAAIAGPVAAAEPLSRSWHAACNV